MIEHCPETATNPESSDPGDLGGWNEPVSPSYASQKNLVTVAQDPRTGTLLAIQGTFGDFGEDPTTSQKVIRSRDCGATWQQVADLDGTVHLYDIEDLNDTLSLRHSIINHITPGDEPGHWLLWNQVADYYLSTDDGETWTGKQEAGEGLTLIDGGGGPNRGGGMFIMGAWNSHDTRADPVHINLQNGVVGFPFIYDFQGIATTSYHGVRRSVGPNGATDWETVLDPTDAASGGSGWQFGSGFASVLGYGGGRWVLWTDWGNTQDWDEDVRTPNMRINTSPDLDPASWSAPFWMVSETFVQDYYEGEDVGLSSFAHEMTNWQNHSRLRFLADPEHAAGGRWWFFGHWNTLLYSDDGGVTWNKSLASHAGDEADMHPLLNWRRTHDLTRASETRITDMFQHPGSPGHIIAIGITYDRAEVDNRLAAYCCSEDGGDTWGDVRQLPLRLSNIGSSGSGEGFDSPAVARHIFPCLAEEE